MLNISFVLKELKMFCMICCASLVCCNVGTGLCARPKREVVFVFNNLLFTGDVLFFCCVPMLREGGML